MTQAPGAGSPVVIQNTDPGCSFSGVWTRTNDNPSGTSGARYVSDQPDALTGFGHVHEDRPGCGHVPIQATWPYAPGNGTRVPYRIFDGTTPPRLTPR